MLRVVKQQQAEKIKEEVFKQAHYLLKGEGEQVIPLVFLLVEVADFCDGFCLAGPCVTKTQARVFGVLFRQSESIPYGSSVLDKFIQRIKLGKALKAESLEFKLESHS